MQRPITAINIWHNFSLLISSDHKAIYLMNISSYIHGYFGLLLYTKLYIFSFVLKYLF
ncbi:hypothetical protein P3J6_80097 [Pseudoalteromonas sp. 3J6]|nr:hypothetical protein P3J6_80097 [Pseudoalteromonas sp. 3J6]